MKIAIDARLYGPEGTGIGRYLENLLKQLEKIDRENEYVVLLRKNNFNLFNPKAKNFKKILTNADWYTVKEQILIPAVLAKEKPDLVHFPHLNVPLLWSGKSVITIHDLTMSQFASAKESSKLLPVFLFKKRAYGVVLNQAVKRALKIFVPSKFVKSQINKVFDLGRNKVEITPEAVDDFFVEEGRKKVSEVKKKKIFANFGIQNPYLLYVGRFYSHKNLETLFAALKLLPEKMNLVLVGKRDQYQEKLLKKAQEMGIADRIIFTGYVSNEDLVVLYQSAEAFVFPSLSEGFGLPGLEAMACGCPVIAAKSSSLPQVYENAAVYFRPKSAQDLAEKISSLQSARKQLIEAGFSQIEKYSWRKMAEATLAGYRDAKAQKVEVKQVQLKRILFLPPIFLLVFFGTYFFFKNSTNVPRSQVVASGIESTFAVFGDSGVGFEEQKKIGDLIEARSPQFLIHTGDVEQNNGTYEQIQKNVLDIYTNLFAKAEFFPSIGNHDAETDGGAPLINTFKNDIVFAEGKPYYYFSKGSVLFVALDSNYSLDDPNGVMITWFDQILEREKGKFAWTVVYFHHPPFSAGIVRDGDKRVVEKLIPIIDKHEVDVVFNGHDHNYQRMCLIRRLSCQTDGTLYIITGGGGAPLYPVIYSDWFTIVRETTFHFLLIDVNRCVFSIRAVDIEDKVFDEFSLQKC